MKYYLFITLLSLSLWPKYFYCQDENIIKIIEKNGLNFIKNKNISSASIGVYKDRKIYTKHFGEIEKDKGNPPNDKSIYEIGSVTKPMIGYVVARAVLEKKIELEDEITMYLGDGYSNLEFNGKTITVKHLLTHTSGLPAFLPLQMKDIFTNLDETVPYKYYELQKSYNKQKFFQDLKKVKLINEPGTTYNYSNVGAELMGFILEKAHNKSLVELLKDSFLTENEMNNTIITANYTQSEIIQGYWMDSNTFSPQQINSLWGTAGHIKMSIEDMMKFIILQLDNENPSVNESHKVLHKEGKTLKLGYFWRVWHDKYGTSYNHHGGTIGTQNWLFIFPKYNLGISVITNQSGPKTPSLLNKTVKKMLKDIIKN